MLLALAPIAAASTGSVCTPHTSQWNVCVGSGCVALDGPALHGETCPGDLVAAICTPHLGQFWVCVGNGCVSVDGPALHEAYCV